ncbi:MAG: putative ABC transporter permease, partial [Lacrimispora sphenoides]
GSLLRGRGMCPWDYTGRNSNIDGLIRLDFAPLWFATGLLFEQITKKKGG